jgi:glycosyl transferase, family 25
MPALYFCINLKRAPERRNSIENEAEKVGIDVIFIDAIDGNGIDPKDQLEYNRADRLRFDQDMLPNEVACVLSHKCALETFLASGASAAVVLEDDAIISPELRSFVEASLDLAFEWDAINLENRSKKEIWPAIAKLGETRVHASAWLSNGTTGWLYSRNGARKVLSSLGSFRHAYDTHLGFFWRHGLTAFCVTPPLVRERNDCSTIGLRTPKKRDVSFSQLLNSRAERIEHEFRKQIEAYKLFFISIKVLRRSRENRALQAAYFSRR